MPNQDLQARFQQIKNKLTSKLAFAPAGSMPPMDPAMAGGAPPMDPAMAGGAPPMDPAMMAGGGAPMPPMDPAMAGGVPPMDPAMMGGAPPMDPAMMGGAPPVDPASMGAMPDPAAAQDPMQMMQSLVDKVDKLTDVVQKLVKKLDGGGADALVPEKDAEAVQKLDDEHEAAEDPVSDQAKEELEKPDEGQSFIQKQLAGLQGGGM